MGPKYVTTLHFLSKRQKTILHILLECDVQKICKGYVWFGTAFTSIVAAGPPLESKAWKEQRVDTLNKILLIP